MDIEQFAPVLILTLNRHVHFKRCVESLSRCTYADKTDIFIALDYPLYESHWEGYNIIKEYLPTIKGFKKITIIERKSNLGPGVNSRSARQEIFKYYDRMISSEDDNEFAPNFLSFINRGLIAYKDRDDIFAICGYNSPVKMPAFYKDDVYLRVGYSWSSGVWRSKREKFQQSENEIREYIDDRKNIAKVKKNSRDFYYMYKEMLKDNKSYGDANIVMYLIMKDMFCVYPVVSRVRNHGHDGSGVHCGYSNIYRNQTIYEKEDDAHFPPDIKPNYKLLRNIQKQRRSSWIIRLRRSIPKKWKLKIKQLIKK